MKDVFVNGLGFVNAQFSNEVVHEFDLLQEFISKAKSPSLKEIISPAMSRRMASGVKMGIYASLKALEEAKVEQPDTIITGTALGCLVDSEKFLINIIQNNEAFLTPTAFIQSTHNTVGSQIALHLGCNAYNFTYTNGFNSFENALLDGSLQVETEEVTTALVGGIDEIGQRTYQLLQLIGEIKSATNQGKKYSEGAHFCVLSNEKSAISYAKLLAVSICNGYEDLYAEILKFIESNHINLSDIDAIISGEESLKDNNRLNGLASLYEYKEFIGEYGTSSAFGFVLGCELLKKQILPSQFKKNDRKAERYKNILLVNGHNGKDLSLILLQSV